MRRQRLNLQFKDALAAISGALQAGYSIENSVVQALDSLGHIYGEQDIIIQEFTYMRSGMKLNRTIEELFSDLAKRSKVEDIQSFCQVFITAKRTGGDIHSIINNTTRSISGKIDTKEEIMTALSGKRMEQKIMSCVPMGIIAYVRLSSPELLEPLYKNTAGIVIMTICLCIYAAAYWLGKKIVDIEV